MDGSATLLHTDLQGEQQQQQQHGTSERLFSDDVVPAGSSVW